MAFGLDALEQGFGKVVRLSRVDDTHHEAGLRQGPGERDLVPFA